MLQFSGVLSNSAIRLSPPRMTWCCITQQLLNSTLSKADPDVPTPQDKSNHATSRPQVKTEVQKTKMTLVETAMQNLKDEKIREETNEKNLYVSVLDSIFRDYEKDKYNHKKSEEAFSLITNLMQKDKIQVSTVLNDQRFIHLLDKLSQQQSTYKVEAGNAHMGVSGTNQLDNYVMMLKTMSCKKIRNVPAIQGVVNVIVKSTNKLNVKQASDVLYSLASINYPDEMLIKKVCNDVIGVIASTSRQSVIRSIITSLGMLQYKDSNILNELSVWTVYNWSSIKSDFVVGLMYTLAIVRYRPDNEKQLMERIHLLKQDEMTSFEQWLSLVWSLTILDRVNTEQISTVLNESFVNILKDALFSVKLKLLNINAAAKYIYTNYKGPFLAQDFQIMIPNRAEKTNYIKALTEPLKSLLPTTATINSNVDTGMGFLLDVECILDEKAISALTKKPSKDLVPMKIAFVIQGYHDFNRGSQCINGINAFQCTLLKSKGYKVLQVPYLDFNVNSKLIERLKYLKTRLSTMLESN